MTKVKELRGHTSRVLHLAKSPDGDVILSASADETLRFWNIFGADGGALGGPGIGSGVKPPGTVSSGATALVNGFPTTPLKMTTWTGYGVR